MSQLTNLKRKQSPNSKPGNSHERSKKDKSEKKRDKGKARASSDATSEFRVVNASLVLSIPPIFANDPRQGALEMIDSMLMRYVPALEGVMLEHSNFHFLDETARIIADCPYMVCKVSFDATVWGPRIGMTLQGTINLCSPDHISLLVYRTFNVSIPRHHIPLNQWEFQYGPAENDPEFAPEAPEVEDTGIWVHHLTSDPIGGEFGELKFTVIGLTVANEMLSLVGSIQDDPFSEEHVPLRRSSVGITDDEASVQNYLHSLEGEENDEEPDAAPVENDLDDGAVGGGGDLVNGKAPPIIEEHDGVPKKKKRKRKDEKEGAEGKKRKKDKSEKKSKKKKREGEEDS